MNAPTLERPAPEPDARNRRPVMLALLVVAAVASLAVAVVLIAQPAGSPSTAAHPRPPLLPAASAGAPLYVTGVDGRSVTCPTGSEPSIYLTGAVFTPALTGGSTMGKRRYHLRLEGSVNNETGAAVDIRTLTVSVRESYWPAKITVARSIAPQSSIRVVIEGDYRSTESGPVDVASHLDWRWHAADLTACGEAGLIEDD